MSNHKLIMEAWRGFLNEGWAEDIKAAIEQGRQDKARAGRKTSMTDQDWEEVEKEKRQQAQDTAKEKESAWKEREKERESEKKSPEMKKIDHSGVLEYNMDKLLEDYGILGDRGGLFFRIGDFYSREKEPSLEQYRQEVKADAMWAIKKDKKNPLNTSKIRKKLGSGAYGHVYELSNGHVLKLFADGMYGMMRDLKWYKEMHDRQFTRQSEPGEIAVYSYGTIVPLGGSAEYSGVGYAEVGKVVPFYTWIAQNSGKTVKEVYYDNTFNTIRDWISDNRYDLIDIKEFEDEWEGGENEYVEYLVSVISKNSLIEPYLPVKEDDGWSVEDLKDIFRAVYRLAKQDGEKYLFTNDTADVHAGNFGYSLQTNRVIVYDK